MSPPESPLDPELLYLFVIGPGTGETILLRVPPNQWIVVDSFINAKRPAAEKLILDHGGSVAVVVLTHPHRDHFGGFLSLVDDYPDSVIGCLHPREEAARTFEADDPISLVKRQAQPTYTRIWDVWQENPKRKWLTVRNQSLPVGQGVLLALHPRPPRKKSDWDRNSLNDLSSAMKFTWHKVTLILGADASKAAWDSIATEFDGIGNHQALKVPHHGSAESIHESFGTGDVDRIWIVTPFASSKFPLPNANEGLAKSLQYVNTLLLTSLPYSHDREHESPCKTSRTNIKKNILPKLTGSVTRDPRLRAERYVAIAFDNEGKACGRWYGTGTLEVTEDAPECTG